MDQGKIRIVNLIILAVILRVASGHLVAQVRSNTLGEDPSETSSADYGELVTKLPSGAMLYKNENDGQRILDDIKKNCKGKSIFIDIWAPWCTPCIDAMPNSRMLYTETSSQPREFIYICTDSRTNVNTWIEKVSGLKLNGIHIFMKEQSIREILNIISSSGGYPSYLFFDRRGNFLPGAIPLNSITSAEKLLQLMKN